MPVEAARRISESVASSKVADLRGNVRGVLSILSSIGVSVIDAEIIKFTRRAIAFEFGWFFFALGGFEQSYKIGYVFWPHFFFDAVGTEACDFAFDLETSFIN